MNKNEIKQLEARCKLRNLKGSEYGTCSCKGRKDCPDPPKITPVGRRMMKWAEGLKR